MWKFIFILLVIFIGLIGVRYILVQGPEKASDIIGTANENIAANEVINKKPTEQKKMNTQAVLKTNKGEITIDFFADSAPNAQDNFKKLAGSGFYDGIKFHRVIKGFMVQGGDPLTKDNDKKALWGTGGPGYKFADEINPASELYKAGYKRGIVAMANSGPDTNGSQFFIMHADYPLPPLYTIFGKVTSGLSVVDAIAETPTDSSHRPLHAVIINSVIIK